MRRNFALLENFADRNDEDECDVTEASDSELWEDVLTAEDITVRCIVHTLQLSVYDFLKAKFSAKEVVSKVRNVSKKTHKPNIRELFKHNNKPFPTLDFEKCWVLRFLMFESMLLVRDLLGQIALANESLFAQTLIGLLYRSLLNA